MASSGHDVMNRVVVLSTYPIASGYSVAKDFGTPAWAKTMEDLYDDFPGRFTRHPTNIIPSQDSTFKLDNLLPKFRASVKGSNCLFVYNCKDIPGEDDAFVVIVDDFMYKFGGETDFDKGLLMAETRMAAENALQNGDSSKQTSLLSDYEDLLDNF